MVSDIFQATSSILLAAFAARRRVGLVLGIISTATAPAAAPIPAVTAHPFTVIAGIGAAAGAVAVLMMPRTNPTRRLAAKAANKVEDVAWKVSDTISSKLDDLG